MDDFERLVGAICTVTARASDGESLGCLVTRPLSRGRSSDRAHGNLQCEA
jgi:hypothetical protein